MNKPRKVAQNIKKVRLCVYTNASVVLTDNTFRPENSLITRAWKPHRMKLFATKSKNTTTGREENILKQISKQTKLRTYNVFIKTIIIINNREKPHRRTSPEPKINIKKQTK